MTTRNNPTKVAVVTGANKGIGFGIVKALLLHPFNGVVYLTARDETRGKEAIARLVKIGLNPRFHQLDIGSLESIKEFGDFIMKHHGGLDVLVNNAAIAFNNDATETFGGQAGESIRVNFFGALNVCHELFPYLRPGARVVNISSSLGHLSKINGVEPFSSELRKQISSSDLTEDALCGLMTDFVKLANEGTHIDAGWPNCTYTVSKVGLSALTRVQQRELDEKRPEADIIVNSVHPGYVATDMNNYCGSMTIEQGSEAPTWLALLPQFSRTDEKASSLPPPRGEFIWWNKEVVDWVNGPTPTPY